MLQRAASSHLFSFVLLFLPYSHGNDLSREMSDVFSCHNVPPMDIQSHRKILLSYGENVNPRVIDMIVSIWEDLRVAHQSGSLIYPFSVRESVNVVKHMNSFPDDGIEDAIDNVIAFDRLDKGLAKHLEGVFGGHGVTILTEERAEKKKYGRSEGGVSTPRTRASSPKHGKVDPDNTPHVGKNIFGFERCFVRNPSDTHFILLLQVEILGQEEQGGRTLQVSEEEVVHIGLMRDIQFTKSVMK